MKPLLAESWDVSRDGLTYTFKLKKGVKWHDGKPFTARDVAFTFYSVLDPKVTTPHRGYFDALVGFPELTNKDNPKKPEELAQKPIEVLDDHTIRFRLRYPYGAFLAVLVNPRAGIIPEHLLKGAGPQHRRVQPEAHRHRPVQVRRVEARGADRPRGQSRLPRGPARPRPPDLPGDPGQRRAPPGAPRRRRRLHRAAAADRGRAAQADAGLKVITADNTSYTYFGFRQDLAPFDDLHVRRALYHAIDVPAIVREVLQGYGVVVERAVPAGQLGVRSLGQALPLRPEPGQGAPRRSRLEAGTRRHPRQGRQAPVLLAPARPGGPDREGHADHHPGVPEEGRRRGQIEPLDWPTFVKKLFASDFEGIVVAGRTSTIPTPSPTRSGTRASGRRRNFAHYKSPRADAALEAARRAARPGRAEEALRRVLEDPHGGRAVRLPLLPPAGLRHPPELRRVRPHPGVRRDLPVDEGREADGR